MNIDNNTQKKRLEENIQIINDRFCAEATVILSFLPFMCFLIL